MKKALLLATLLATLGAAQAEPATYKIDPNHTAVTFEAKHFGTSTLRGRWDKKEGSVTLDKAAKTGKVEFTIDMASITTGSPQFDGHLKSKDFFLVEEFPTAKFVGDKFTFNGDKVASVAGELTLRGVTKPVTLAIADFRCGTHLVYRRAMCSAEATATIRRSEFGMTSGLPNVAGDDVRIVIPVEATIE